VLPLPDFAITNLSGLRMKILGKGGMRLEWSASQHLTDYVAEEEEEFEEDDGHQNINTHLASTKQQLRMNVNGTHHVGMRRTSNRGTNNATNTYAIMVELSQRHQNQQEHKVKLQQEEEQIILKMLKWPREYIARIFANGLFLLYRAPINTSLVSIGLSTK
jgi:hypothetical protein